MIDTVIKKIKITKDLQSKIFWACTFSKVEPMIIEGNLHIVEKTNLAYVEPHKVLIKDKVFLFFNDSKYFYVEDLIHKYPLSSLKELINKLIF